MDLTPERPPIPPDPNRDAGKLDPSEYSPLLLEPTPRGRKAGFQVVFRRSALDAIHAHGKESLHNEICGVVVGQVHTDKRGPYLYIAAAIRGEHANHHAAQVTFTSETWTGIHQVMDSDYPDLRIVGWYHSHPGFGVFLSGMDLFIHDNFFDLPWQIAFVYDPIGGDEASFVWRAGQTKREPFLVHEVPDAWTVARQQTETSAPMEENAPPDGASSGGSTSTGLPAGSSGLPHSSATNGGALPGSQPTLQIDQDSAPSAQAGALQTTTDQPSAGPALSDASSTENVSTPPATTVTPETQYWHLPPFRAIRLFTRDLFRRQFRGSQNR